MAYQPQPGTLVDRVCRWFLINIEEELTPADIATRFDVANRSSIGALLASAITHQLLVRAKGDDGVMVYKAGPKLNTLREAPIPAGPVACVPPKVRRHLPALPDPSDLVIDTDVPIPPSGNAPKYGRYTAVFARMGVGHSFKCSAADAKRLYESANKWGKNNNAKFSKRLLNDTEARIWRIA